MNSAVRSLWLLLALLLSWPALARELVPAQQVAPYVTARIQAMCTPGDDIAGEIISAIQQARQQVLVQAFSFTHDGIAQALIEAHRRGVAVKVIADRKQTEKLRHGQVPRLARAGVPAWLDGTLLSAHNNVMVIDAGSLEALIITGPYNFTLAANTETQKMLPLSAAASCWCSATYITGSSVFRTASRSLYISAPT